MSVQLAPLSWLGITADSANYLAVRWWAHFGVFHFYASLPIHIAVPATDLFATEQFYIQELQPSLNFGFIERHFRPRTGFIRQLDFSQSRHMGFATIWRKRRRLRLPIALQQAFLAKRMSNRLDLWRLFGRSWQQRPTTIRCHPLHTEQRLPARCPIHPSSHRYTLA